MKVRYPTQCARCHQTIGIGQHAVRPYGRPYWHSACYGRYARERNIPMERRVAVR